MKWPSLRRKFKREVWKGFVTYSGNDTRYVREELAYWRVCFDALQSKGFIDADVKIMEWVLRPSLYLGSDRHDWYQELCKDTSVYFQENNRN